MPHKVAFHGLAYFHGDVVEIGSAERVTVDSQNPDGSLNVVEPYAPNAIVRLPVCDSVDARLVRGAP